MGLSDLVFVFFICKYMGQNYQDWKYALFVSLFVTFHCHLESKWALWEPRKNTQLTSTLRRVMALPCFHCKLPQFKIFCLPFQTTLFVNCFKFSQFSIKQSNPITVLSVLVNWVFLSQLSDGLFWLQVTMKTDKKWHEKCIFPILIIWTHINYQSF